MRRDRPGRLRRARLLLGLLLFPALVVGCFLQLLVGTVFQSGGSLVTTVETDAVLATCVDSSLSEATRLECNYFIRDESGIPVSVTATSSLISEFGVLGLFVDPLILQVPAPVSDVAASFDDGSGPQPLVVTETASFDVDSTRSVSAEAGTTFLIVELPDAVAASLPNGPPAGGPAFAFSLSFTVPEQLPHVVKPMLSLRVDVADRSFFLPQIPCVTDFADVPAVTLPVPMTNLDLTPIVAAAFAGVSGCQDAFYEFFGVSLDHRDYRFWKARAPAKPAGTHAVTDALGSRDVDLVKTALLGAPANRDNRDPGAVLAPEHLVAYKVARSAGEPKPEKVRGVEVANLYGVQTVDLKKPDLLLLPAAMSLTVPVPPLVAPAVNPFLCWRTRNSRGGKRLPKGIQALVVDTLGAGTVALKRPVRLCLPADVDGQAPGAEDAVAALMCFKARAAKPRPAGRDGVHTADAVGPQVLAVRKPAELCLPSTVRLP